MKFNDLGLDQPILDVLQKKQITDPTPIQEQSILPILKGDDVLGIAMTGTGKTLAFVMPILQQLVNERATETGAALIITPTRELASQIEEAVRWFEHATKMKSTVIVGGAPEGKQVQALRRRPQIVVATPGRLQDLLDQKKIRLNNTKHIVLDEADRMLDMGFAPQINKIFQHVPGPEERQLLLFSATMPNTILKMVQTMMRNPVHIEIAPSGSTIEATKQEVVIMQQNHRKDALLELLDATKGTILVFTRTKYQAKNINRWLRGKNYKSEELHGNQSLPQRRRALDAVMKKRSRILIATDIAARGIDIPHIELVVNFILPDNPEDYVHRIGRTGRAGRSGRAISFVATNQAEELQAIQKVINMRIEQTQLKSIPGASLDPTATPQRKGRRPQNRSGGGGSFSRNQNRGRNSGQGRQRSRGSQSNSPGGKRRSRSGSAPKARIYT
ncbi:MAG: DEAD/DEAH box helicase [Candidatus Kerfeldbacteria bacterium]